MFCPALMKIQNSCHSAATPLISMLPFDYVLGQFGRVAGVSRSQRPVIYRRARRKVVACDSRGGGYRLFQFLRSSSGENGERAWTKLVVASEWPKP